MIFRELDHTVKKHCSGDSITTNLESKEDEKVKGKKRKPGASMLWRLSVLIFKAIRGFIGCVVFFPIWYHIIYYAIGNMQLISRTIEMKELMTDYNKFELYLYISRRS